MTYSGFGTSGQVLTSNGPNQDPTFQDATGGSFSPGYQSGWYYYPSPIMFSSTSTRSISSSFFYVQPIFVREEITIDQITFTVTTAASSGKQIRIGRYTNLNGRPTTIAETFGTVVVDSTGDKTLGSLSSTIPAGYSWLAWQSEETVTLQANTITHQSNALPSQAYTSKSTFLAAMFNFSGSVWANGFTDLSAVSPGNTNNPINVMFRIS